MRRIWNVEFCERELVKYGFLRIMKDILKNREHIVNHSDEKQHTERNLIYDMDVTGMRNKK